MKQTTIAVSPASYTQTDPNDGVVLTKTIETLETYQSFNWLTVLKELADGATINEESLDSLKLRAGRWPTCACGQLGKLLLREWGDAAPQDRRLRQWGSDFALDVSSRNWREALYTFQRIEERTAQLLRVGYENTIIQRWGNGADYN